MYGRSSGGRHPRQDDIVSRHRRVSGVGLLRDVADGHADVVRAFYGERYPGKRVGVVEILHNLVLVVEGYGPLVVVSMSQKWAVDRGRPVDTGAQVLRARNAGRKCN